MERTSAAAMVPAEMGWNDVGAWSALWGIGAKDDNGNVVGGDVMTVDVRNSYVRSEGRLVAAVGMEDLIVVATDDVALEVPRDRVQDVKAVVDGLKKAKPAGAGVPPAYLPAVGLLPDHP